MQQGFMDGLLDMLQLTPFRCNSCHHRFFRFRQKWAKVVIPLSLCLCLFASTAVAFKVVPWARDLKRTLTRLPPPPPTQLQGPLPPQFQSTSNNSASGKPSPVK
jgi:hypothetical protein